MLRSLFPATVVAGLFTHMPAFAETFAVDPSDPAAADLLTEAMILAEDGDVIEIGAGTIALTRGLTLSADDITIRGEGPDATILSFAGQVGSGEGMLIQGDRLVLEGFAVEDTPGDGIKTQRSDQTTFRNLRVEWTGGPDEGNGAYGLYPVQSTNVLIEDSVVRGASDAGIYVGQSADIVVRRNRVEFNVAGIEIENSFRADVHDNIATRNTGGILVFDLPNLPQMGGRDVRVYDNVIVDNDTPNFAPEGNIVGLVPRGTGVMVMANRNVHVFGNELSGNDTVHVLVASYPRDYEDADYIPWPRGVVIRDNSYGPGGREPAGEVGELISGRVGTPVPDIVWDGVTSLGEYATWLASEDRLYIAEGEGTTFANLRMITHTLMPWTVRPHRDIADHAGSLPELEPVTLAQGR